MAYRVSIINTELSFGVEAHESVLQAAQRQGIVLPYGCGMGVCGICMSRIVSGEMRYPEPPLALFEEDEQAGLCLYCVGVPVSDLVLQVPELS